MNEFKPLFGKGNPNVDYAKYFVGDSHLNILQTPNPEQGLNFMSANVTFEPGTRNNWHVHEQGYQLLLITDGEGWYQEHGKEAITLKPGDVVCTLAGIKHWHGAKKDTWMSHVAITAGNALWYEQVSDNEYNSL